ncbi:orcokinin peptides type A-like isoform X2 [Hermetia illucens]|uniref:orcokinin peptides type A-like isoform X2 n=1 Tax=Hermetia illucens TaxID=343691 RepID=UPI0018CC6E7E|nr:orcokinin peptides type A-like isoform X2 [Hermetia illucens]
MMMRSAFIAFAVLFVGVTLSLPLKNNEVEDYVMRPNDMYRFAPYSVFGKGHFRGRRLPMTPSMYNSYLNTFDRDEKDTSKKASGNFDEIDRSGFMNFAKRNFDEIDRVGFSNL